MASMRMSVDVDFLGGTTIDEALSEALVFSRKNNCFVDFNFNGVALSVRALTSHKEADIETYKKMYYSMLKERERKEQEDREVHTAEDKGKHDLDEQVTKLVKAMDLVDEAYKWFSETNWHRDAIEDSKAIQRKMGQLISDINDIRQLKEEQQ